MPDIFISYAHNNDKPVHNEENGWVALFVEALQNEVNQRMGRTDESRVWVDYRLSYGCEITPAIEKLLGETQVLVILMSPCWLKSEWCQRELEIFSRGLPHVAERIFVVELEPISTAEKPPVLHDSLTCRFWKRTNQDKVRKLGYPVPHSSDGEYYDKLVDLSHDLAKAIPSNRQAAPIAAAKATVYVAPVNDSLEEQRASLIRGLRQWGIDSLPRNNTWDDNMIATLEKCSHFVQLLDAHRTMGIPVDQHRIAEAAGKPILQWRDPKLDFTGTQDDKDQKKLLEGKTVFSVPMVDFIRMVREAILPKPPEDGALTKRNGELTVFIFAGQDDLGHAKNMAQTLISKGYGIALPRYRKYSVNPC